MFRRFFLFLLFLSGLLAPVLSQTTRPNIIYIMADDLGYADLSCYGRKDYKTPNLDKLAGQGVKFMNAYAASSLCTPTRTAFMTGRYPARTPVGLMEPLRGRHKDSIVGLTPDYTSVATLLKKSGYETYLIGKWHLGFGPQYSPNKNGYDYFFGFHSGGNDYISHSNRKGQGDLYENETPVKKEGYLTDIWREKAVEIIKEKHGKPFFLSIMFNAPHWPWQAPGDNRYPDSWDWDSGGTKEKFAAMMKSMDDAVGKIMQAIDDENIAGNTLVIFTSDNGGEEFSDMGVYSGGKDQLWEGGIREPAFARWPGVIPANSITQQETITMDWTATILAVAGAKPDPSFPPDGINLLPICTGKEKAIERTFYWRLFQSTKQKAIRQGNWKYLQTEDGEFLFNLVDDPGEKKDMKEKFPDLFEQLKKKYGEWEMGVLKPVEL
ncbi:sulfatase-like hydrolase/transferase [Panacibacter ginsenosidivorans]|uniref:Sulfatase-like hydrolase/transferase n=1 Tax=Panacibacter ginsenosidivorans TaxID=1813871 RepID=A0A5B8V6H7_9BACT|nr:sulfatase-like hydrolase/transferase [Panacibacter ginsenosidivorans]QEC66809.1 sulfatase-like hydrolase/transferase [Panacibacter ginsenosidivorans]